jgi:hypothetical protein
LGLKEWWDKFAFSRSEDYSYFEIDNGRILNTYSPSAAENFIPMKTYFEVRLKQMFLQNQRVYTREYEPLAHATIEFQFAGESIQSPIVIGPTMLANVDKVSDGDQIEFLNIRLIGPCPYEGEDVKIFTGLFRMVTKDWSKSVLSLLENFSKTFDSSQLSSFINIAQPLTDGIQGFMGMKELEMRVGRYIHYAAPDTGPEISSGALRPCFVVHLRRPSSEIDDSEEKKFWVKEGRLHYGDSEADLVEYKEADFMLLQITPLVTRGDYTGFDFHKKHWKKIESLLAEQKNDDAFSVFKLLVADLVLCDDIIHPHRIALLKKYREQMDSNIEFYKELYSTDRIGMLPTRYERAPDLEETDLHLAVEEEIDMEDFSAEDLVTKFTK